MPGKFSFTPAEYAEAAHKYRKEFLYLPIEGCSKTLQYMTKRPGIRGKESVGTLEVDAQFAPYKYDRTADANLTLTHRTLETYFGNVVSKFEPNSAIGTILGTGATMGDGQAVTPTAKLVLARIAKQLSHHLNAAIFNGTRNAEGNTTKDLFDGFDTITQKEITATNIKAENGNYLKLGEAITDQNAYDIAKEILYSLDDNLRDQKCYLFCTRDFVDKYNQAYMLSHSGIPFYNEFGQQAVEGSEGNLIFAPLANKKGSKFFQVAPADNMLVGFDQMGADDKERVEVERFDPFLLTYVATMFFGVQFESIDKSRLKVIEMFS